jgi:hypothetical protein
MSEHTVPDEDETFEMILDMMQHMAEYLKGPGFDDFLAWLDQKFADGPRCPNCGKGVHADSLRINIAALDGWFRGMS